MNAIYFAHGAKAPKKRTLNSFESGTHPSSRSTGKSLSLLSIFRPGFGVPGNEHAMCCIGNAAITGYSRNLGPCLVSARADPLEVKSNGRMIRLRTGSMLLTGLQGSALGNVK